jgi:hypothetical protein
MKSVSGFASNTHIETGNDRILVGDLTPGMFVLGMKKKIARPAKVLATHGLRSGTVVCLHLGNGVSLTVAPGTRMIREGCGWTVAEKIRAGDQIRGLLGNVCVDMIEVLNGSHSVVLVALEGKHDICAEGIVCRP